MISAKTREMLNSLHELTFSTTADSVEAGYIREDYYAVVKVEGQYREFIIDSIVESDDSELIKEVKASLSSIELNDTLLENKVTGSDPRLLLTSILSTTRWSVGTVETGIYNRNFTEDVQFMTALEAIHTLAEFYNCDIHFSYIIDGNKVVKRSVNLFVRLGSADGKRFEIDKDITSIEREIDTTALKTAIYPVMKTEDDDGKTVLTSIANVAWSKAAGDPVDKPLGQKYVGDPVALQNWGRLDKNGNLRHRMKLYEFTEEVTVAQMLSMSWVNLAKYTSPKITYTVNVLDLYSLLGEDYLHEKVVIGDTVTIIDRYFAVPIEISDRVIEIERDLLDPSNTVVTVGTESKSYNSDRGGRDQVLNDRIDAVNKNAVSALESANGKNTNYYGSLEPAKPNTGDTWFRPHPDNPEEQQMLVWDGVQWIVELDTSKISEIQDAIAVIDSDLEENIKTANDAVNKAQQAIESAGFANSSITAANGQIASLEQNLNGFQQVVQNTYADKTTVTALANQWTQTTELAKGHTSKISSLGDQLNLRVTKGELISQINVSPETILIDSKRIQIKGDTYIENAIIKSSHIASLDASKITAGTLNAANVNIINLNVANLVGDRTSFIRSSWNSISNNISITANGIESTRSDGSISAKYLSDGMQIWGGGLWAGSLSWASGNNVVLWAKKGHDLHLGYQGTATSTNTYTTALAISGDTGLINTYRDIEMNSKALIGTKYLSGITRFDGTGDVEIFSDKVLRLRSIGTIGYTTNKHIRFRTLTMDGVAGLTLTNEAGSGGFWFGDNGDIAFKIKGTWYGSTWLIGK